MASTVFQDYNQNNPIVSSWLNDVNKATYSSKGVAKTAIQSSSAWVRFQVSGGVVTILQSSNVASVVRSSVGVYVITYTTPLTNGNNCYALSMNALGFTPFAAETAGNITIEAFNISGTAFDPDMMCLTVFGAN